MTLNDKCRINKKLNKLKQDFIIKLSHTSHFCKCLVHKKQFGFFLTENTAKYVS